MIAFPPEFVATRYPGYYWNTVTNCLFSIKVTGVLRPIKIIPANRFNKWAGGYAVSVGGHKEYLRQDYLLNLKPNVASIVPVQQLAR